MMVQAVFKHASPALKKTNSKLTAGRGGCCWKSPPRWPESVACRRSLMETEVRRWKSSPQVSEETGGDRGRLKEEISIIQSDFL